MFRASSSRFGSELPAAQAANHNPRSTRQSNRPAPKGGSVPRVCQHHPVNDDLRLQLLRLLTDYPELSQRELAQRLGLSLGKTNYCLRALVDKGLVKVNNFRTSQNKLAYAYVLTASGMRAKVQATSTFLRRKQLEYARLEHEIAELRAEVSAGSEQAMRQGGRE